MNFRGYPIADILDYIEANLESELSLETIAGNFHYSAHHLHRIFSSLAGIPLIAYVRKRRLASALPLLADTNSKIIDIALKLGFDYEQSFIRAFKEEFRITPSRYRRSGTPLKLTPKLCVQDIELLQTGLILPPSQVFLPAMDLIGMSRLIETKDPRYLELPNQTGREFVTEESLKIQGDVDRSVYYARVDHPLYLQEAYQYTPSFAYRKLNQYPDILTTYELPSRSYIMFRYMGNHSPYEIDMRALQGIYQYINENFREYLLERCDPRFKLERIDENLCRADYCEMDFLYPLHE